MDGSDSYGHKQVNDRYHKAFRTVRAALWSKPWEFC